MSDQERLSSAQRELERALKGLQPDGTGLGRDLLMFRAGQRSRRAEQRLSLLLAFLMAGATGALLLHRPAAVQWPRAELPLPADVRQAGLRQPDGLLPEPPAPLALPEPAAYLKLRQEVLEHGVDALPVASAGTPEPNDARWRRPFPLPNLHPGRTELDALLDSPRSL